MTIKEARKTIAKAFAADTGFRETYVAQVACILMDRIPGFKRNSAKRNKLADEIIHRLFE